MRGSAPAHRAFGAQVVDGRPKAGHDAVGPSALKRVMPGLAVGTASL
jgi:hypothetical protein